MRAKAEDLDRRIALNAAQISTVLKLAVAGSMILAAARTCDWAQVEHFEDIEGVKDIERKTRLPVC